MQRGYEGQNNVFAGLADDDGSGINDFEASTAERWPAISWRPSNQSTSICYLFCWDEHADAPAWIHLPRCKACSHVLSNCSAEALNVTLKRTALYSCDMAEIRGRGSQQSPDLSPFGSHHEQDRNPIRHNSPCIGCACSSGTGIYLATGPLGPIWEVCH